MQWHEEQFKLTYESTKTVLKLIQLYTELTKENESPDEKLSTGSDKVSSQG